MINNYPYTDFHELNLDFVVNKLYQLDNRFIRDTNEEVKKYVQETMYDKVSLDPGIVRHPIDANIANEIIEVAMSYYNHNDDLIYGNQTALNRVMDSINNRMEIDCSTFFALVMNGVPYEASRYAHPDGDRDSNIPQYPWATDLYSYAEEDPDGRGYTEYRRYAQMICYYLRKNGYNFVPKADFSNCCTGDIVYVTNGNETVYNPDGSVYSYRGITHGYIFINRINDGGVWKMRCIDASDGDHGAIAIKLLTYSDVMVEASRPVGNAIHYSVSPDILDHDGAITDIPVSTGTPAKVYNINGGNELDENEYVTVVLKPSSEVHGNIMVRCGAFAATEAKPYYRGTYIAYIRMHKTETTRGTTVRMYMAGDDAEPLNADWAMVFRGAHCYPLASYER